MEARLEWRCEAFMGFPVPTALLSPLLIFLSISPSACFLTTSNIMHVCVHARLQEIEGYLLTCLDQDGRHPHTETESSQENSHNS